MSYIRKEMVAALLPFLFLTLPAINAQSSPEANQSPVPLQLHNNLQLPTLSPDLCRRDIPVSDDPGFSTAVASARPGDCIVLADGSYTGVVVTRSGNIFEPIVIKAAHQGKATISSGTLYLNGVSFVIVQGLDITTPGGPIPSTTAFGAAVALTNTNFSRITRCTFQLVNPGKYIAWTWLDNNSNANRIDHNEYGPYTGNKHDTFLFVQGNPVIPGVTPPTDRTSWALGHGPYNPNMARFTLIDHNYFHDKASGSSETIVLGGIGVTGDYQNTYNTVADNLFVNCDGDAEIISIKSSSNLILHNTVITSAGILSARSGNNNVFDGNFVLAGKKPGSGGIKLNERNQVVFNNYIENTDQYPIFLENGTPYAQPGFAHAQVVNARITYNTFVNGSRQVLIGHSSTTPLKPDGTVFANNIIAGGTNTLFSDDHSTNSTYTQNIIYPYNPNLAGFTVVDPLFTTVNDLQKLSSQSPAIGFASKALYPYVIDDMDGQLRDSAPDSGADEFSYQPIRRQPLTPADVGPNTP